MAELVKLDMTRVETNCKQKHEPYILQLDTHNGVGRRSYVCNLRALLVLETLSAVTVARLMCNF
jgi:hypothetical protein